MANNSNFWVKAIAAAAGAATYILIGAGVANAGEARERILREGRITIGISNGAPWGYRDEDGNAAGFHPDLIKAAFDSLGVDKVELVIAEFGALIPGLTTNRFDAVAAGLAITPERCDLVAFSDPDLRIADAALVPKGNPKRIHSYAEIAGNEEIMFGAGRGSTTAKNAAAAGVPEERMLLFPDIQANISALMAGRIDVAAFSSPTVARILADTNISGIERALPFQGHIESDGRERFGYSAIAFRHEDADLRDLYNSRLKDLKADGTLADLMKRYNFSAQETAPDLSSQQICDGAG
jgi:polar amino acid transport system substrate-binding protein